MDEDMVGTYAARSALCRKHGDEISADYWAEQAVRLSDHLEELARRAEYDVLKGSPDHSAGSNERL